MIQFIWVYLLKDKIRKKPVKNLLLLTDIEPWFFNIINFNKNIVNGNRYIKI